MTAAIDVRPRPPVTREASRPAAGVRLDERSTAERFPGHLALSHALLGELRAAEAAADLALGDPSTPPDEVAAAELALAWMCLQEADAAGAERHAHAAAALDPVAAVAPVLDVLRRELSRMRRSGPRSAGRPGPEGLLVEPLTTRETEVLHHLDALLSTEEIAVTLFISVNTVKTHVRAILRKLSAERRYDAVRRAREWGLI